MTMTKYMAYNHNGTPLLLAPVSKQRAEKEVKDYMRATSNPAYVEPVEE